MVRTIVALMCLASSVCLWASDEKRPSYPSYTYDFARIHEIKPHRRTIPIQGVSPPLDWLRLKLTVSPTGDVVNASASGDREMLKFWPQLQAEVRQWKFAPFEENGKAVTAEVEEYIELVPPERRPTTHVAAPLLQPNSKVTITLARMGSITGGSPSYTVLISTENLWEDTPFWKKELGLLLGFKIEGQTANGIVFEGHDRVVASGKHGDKVDVDEVRKFAKRFVAADFYSMDSSYKDEYVVDIPTYILSIAIDGHTKNVEDYWGPVVGMPAVITELEDEVDSFARTERWIDGNEGLVQALKAENMNFQSFAAQVMLKEAASRGRTATVREFLEAGVPLKPLPPPPIPVKPTLIGTCETGPCQPGDTRAFDNMLYAWDGSKWVPKN